MDFDECASNPKVPIAAPELQREGQRKLCPISRMKQGKNNTNNHHCPRSKMGSSSHGLLTLPKEKKRRKKPEMSKEKSSRTKGICNKKVGKRVPC
jgi:hypothetical protein